MHVPEGWKKEVLEAVFPVIDSLHQTPVFSKDGYSMVRVTDIKYGSLDLSKTVKVSKKVFDEYTKNHFPKKGDIVLSRVGTYGVSSYVKTEEPFCLGQNTVILNSTDQANSLYIYYFLNSENIKRQIDRKVDGSSHRTVTLKVLRNLKILTPPLAEQEKIAEILSTWDHAIEQTERLKANAETHKQALMQQLLTGKKRFPEFEGEWEKIRLGDYAKIQSGGTPRTTIAEYYDNGKIPWVSISDMTAYGKYINKTDRNITDKGLENSSAKLYPQGTVLYAMYASIGEVSIASVDLTSSQAILGIQPDPEVINNHYLYFYLKSLQEKIILMGQQGTQSNLNAGMVKGFRLNLPSLEEQQKIAAVLNTADREIELLAQKLDYLKTEKRALMQQLLTGKRRVKVDG